MGVEEKAGWCFFVLVAVIVVSVIAHGLIEQRNNHELKMKLIACEVNDVAI